MRGSIVATAVAISMVIGILVGYLLAGNRSTSTEDAALRRDASSEQPATDARRPSTRVSPDAAPSRPRSSGTCRVDGAPDRHAARRRPGCLLWPFIRSKIESMLV